MDYRVIIAGCRDFDNYELLKERCELFLRDKTETHNVIIVSGHAPGADAMGERFAKEHGLPCEIHPADWAKYGRSAGPIRNAEMASCSDALIAFWDGQNPGTRSMIELARKKGLQVAVVYFTDKK
jgi:hypothetical protein